MTPGSTTVFGAVGRSAVAGVTAVRQSGRRRAYPGALAAAKELRPACSCPPANVIRRALCDVATHIAMIAPVGAGTLRVEPVANRLQTIPVSAPGSARMMINGLS